MSSFIPWLLWIIRFFQFKNLTITVKAGNWWNIYKFYPSEWNRNSEYVEGKEAVKNLKVVNDIAEIGVNLFQDLKKLIKNNKEEEQLLL